MKKHKLIFISACVILLLSCRRTNIEAIRDCDVYNVGDTIR